MAFIKIQKIPRVLRNTQVLIGGFIVAVLIIMALFAPILATHDPIAVNIPARLGGPSAENLLGTDELGRDVLSRLIFGTRISLTIGVLASVIGTILGVSIGVVAGYYGKWIDAIVMRLCDILLAFPGILLALGIITILGASTFNTIVAVSIFAVPGFARIARGQTMQVKKLEYIDAIRAVGASDFRILLKHILPNILSPITVQSTLYVASAIVTAASLSFLGLGTQAPTPEWGTMLASGREFLRQAPHLVLYPGLSILITVLGINLLGDGLREALAPRGR
ncbi:MAG: ABC transporter permease [Defluviitaleaceae bacterium]|nr:ABC transporter permease [Defluviitaleaceae bacterium]